MNRLQCRNRMTGRRPIASLSAPRNGPKTKCRTEPMAPGMTVKWSKSSSWVMGQGRAALNFDPYLLSKSHNQWGFGEAFCYPSIHRHLWTSQAFWWCRNAAPIVVPQNKLSLIAALTGGRHGKWASLISIGSQTGAWQYEASGVSSHRMSPGLQWGMDQNWASKGMVCHVKNMTLVSYGHLMSSYD